MTAPEIGNVGVNPEDFESPRPFCAGFVVRDLSPRVSNWRANGSLAVVGDRIVQPGDKVGSETVKAITARGVVLESGGRTRELPLKRFEDTVKKKETKQP